MNFYEEYEEEELDETSMWKYHKNNSVSEEVPWQLTKEAHQSALRIVLCQPGNNKKHVEVQEMIEYLSHNDNKNKKRIYNILYSFYFDKCLKNYKPKYKPYTYVLGCVYYKLEKLIKLFIAQKKKTQRERK